MTISQLQYVLALADQRNFSLAAEKCFVTQPTLSMQIQKLEDELGVLIFDRSKKTVRITEIGKQIVAQAQVIVEESKRIKDIVDFGKGYIGGIFRLGIIPTVMPTLLPMFLKNFTKKHPNVQLIVEEFATDEIIQNIKNNRLDAAIAATPLLDSEIKEKPLYYEPFVGYFPKMASEKKEFTTDEIDTNDLLLLKDGHCFTNGILNICNATFSTDDRKFELFSGSFETLIGLCNEGLGNTFLPYLHTLDMCEKSKKNLINFKDPKPSREVSLIFPKSHLKMHIINALHETISQVIRGAIAFHDVAIISPKRNTK